MTSSVMTKPMFSYKNNGSCKDMWKDPERMNKWLEQPNEHVEYISIIGEENQEYSKIDIKEYNRIQNEAQMIFCSATDWPSYCISYLELKYNGGIHNEIIKILKGKYGK